MQIYKEHNTTIIDYTIPPPPSPPPTLLCLSQKIQITPPLTVFLRHGKLDFYKAPDSIYDHTSYLSFLLHRQDFWSQNFPHKSA